MPGIFKEIMRHEVIPAIGCTEPISCALAAAAAARELGSVPTGMRLLLDAGTYKNGAHAVIPNTNGARGNLLAALIGARIADPSHGLEIMNQATPELVAWARAGLQNDAFVVEVAEQEHELNIDVRLTGDDGQKSRCVISGSHTTITLLRKNGKQVRSQNPLHETGTDNDTVGYREQLRRMPFAQVLAMARTIDEDDRQHLRRAMAMNLRMVDAGMELRRVGYQLQRIQKKGLMQPDLFFLAKTNVAAAVDGRMGGLALPAMTSGGSGNQGLMVAITLNFVARELGWDEAQLCTALATAHLVNAYAKCFLGELAPVCGCAIGAGLAVAVSIVVIGAGLDMDRITFAVNNVVGDLSGLICDGAKPGCSLKAVSSVDSALRSAFMALDDEGLGCNDGLVAGSAEETIRNLETIVREGMGELDPAIVRMMQKECRVDL